VRFLEGKIAMHSEAASTTLAILACRCDALEQRIVDLEADLAAFYVRLVALETIVNAPSPSDDGFEQQIAALQRIIDQQALDLSERDALLAIRAKLVDTMNCTVNEQSKRIGCLQQERDDLWQCTQTQAQEIAALQQRLKEHL